jgi:uncharacterized SAM-dependent methyltransferase
VGPGGGLLIGADRKKEETILHAAYNDGAGVTAAFNLNLLTELMRNLVAISMSMGFATRHSTMLSMDGLRCI